MNDPLENIKGHYLASTTPIDEQTNEISITHLFTSAKNDKYNVAPMSPMNLEGENKTQLVRELIPS